MKHRLLCIFVFASLLSLNAFGTDYYVSPSGSDSNPGTQASPWKTIQHADAALTVGAPQTCTGSGLTLTGVGACVHVLSGNYNISSTVSCNGGTSAICTARDGTSGARIAYVADVKWGPKLIIASNPDSCWHATGSYVDYVGFDITENASSGSCRSGLWVQRGHTTVQRNFVHDLNRNSLIASCNNNGGSGLLVSSQNAIAPVDTALVDSNMVDNIGGQASGYFNHSCHFVHNFYMSMSNLTITNNISLRSESVAFSFGGHANQPVINYIVINNAAIDSGFEGFYWAENAGGTDIGYNNIVYQRTAGFAGGMSFSSESSPASISNNLAFLPAGDQMYINTHSGVTIANPQTGNPLFVKYTGDASGDYHLQAGSPAIASGATSCGGSCSIPQRDFDGTAMSTPPPIGAYTFGSVTQATQAPGAPTGLIAVVR